MASNKEEKLKIHYDADIDALSVIVHSGPEEEFVEIAPGVSVEFDEKKNVIGFEILDASRHFREMLPKMRQYIARRKAAAAH